VNSSEESLTVSELNNHIRNVLTSGFPAPLWICGEVQELRDKKHLYFTLSEKDPESNAIVAKIGVTIWANSLPRIQAILQKAENAFTLKDDIEVKLLCKVDFYPPFGQVRIIAESIDPTYTLGKIAQDRQRLIAALKLKGTLDKNKQLAMPRLPMNIGLITSYDSAAYHDFVDELKKSGYTFRVQLIDTIMQGKTSEASVSKAINMFNKTKDIDVIVITRGGGSIADLSCFDSQMIAEAIAASHIPVLSGIGHEINTTITDLAAHTFAKTPTATARYLIGRVEEFIHHLEEKQDYLFDLVNKTLIERRQYIRNHALTLQQSTMGLIKAQHNTLTRVKETFKRLPLSLIKEKRKHTDQINVDLKRIVLSRLQTSKTKIQAYQKFIEVADPKNILKRGFSITRDSKGLAIKSVKNLTISTITTQLSDGIITSTIEDINKG
jgi:exodeoxyribonuclease VII large subunit